MDLSFSVIYKIIQNLSVYHQCLWHLNRKRLVRTVLIFTESSDQLSRATDRVPGLPASPG
ncbi:porin, partial [Escherichia coli]|nr:porin [Escherichia coli]